MLTGERERLFEGDSSFSRTDVEDSCGGFLGGANLFHRKEARAA